MGLDDYLEDIRMAPTVADREEGYLRLVRYLRHRSKVDRIVGALCAVLGVILWILASHACA